MIRWIVIAVVCLYAVGFLVFASSLPKKPHELNHIEGIVALTGGGSRLDAAVALFEKGVGERLLISGVNPQTTREELKTLSHGGKRFDCCADLGYAAENTFGNAQEAAAWARFHHFKRILLVTARYHMPRSIVEFHDVMPGAVVTPYPVDSEDSGPWWKDLRSLRVLHNEYAKYLAVSVLTAAGLEPGLDRGTAPAESRAAS
ncbi:MAG TPA: YdcF family protein [Rhizomicrobium sp.]|nr:YdcF family protein [Rhizomicrobium sp.]